MLPIQALVCVASFGIALPFTIALFPQMSEVTYAQNLFIKIQF